MKLPRWIVIAMLTSSVLAPLAAASWWWVMWPERTAREFCQLIRECNARECRQLYRPTISENELLEYVTTIAGDNEILSRWRSAQFERIGPRDWSDLLHGRLRFRIKYKYAQNSYIEEYFQAQMGAVCDDER